jgi:peptide/nickel transport system permease protein
VTTIEQPAGRFGWRPLAWLRRGGISGFILRRAFLSLVVLFVISILVFVGTQALGDPARAILGRHATPAGLANLRQQLHLNRPLVNQYGSWIGGLLHGDLGMSLAAREPVSTLLGARLVNSAVLVAIAGIISTPLSVAIGAYAALRPEKLFDSASSIVLMALAALPDFVIGVLLVIVFATTLLHELPATSPINPGQSPWQVPEELILPVVTLVIYVAPYVARIMRASMVEVLESDYVEMARLKGLPERVVLMRHALPNALGPAFQAIAINLAYLAGAIVIVEYVFDYPGIGSALESAVVNHDVPVVQDLALLIAAVYVILNLLADIATILVTPRLRTRL